MKVINLCGGKCKNCPVVKRNNNESVEIGEQKCKCACKCESCNNTGKVTLTKEQFENMKEKILNGEL